MTKWLLLLLLGASLANAQDSGKRCLADFARDERERTELYANTISPDAMIARAQHVLGECPDEEMARSVILLRDDVSWIFTTTNPKQSFNSMIDFLRDQSEQINDSDPLELSYMHMTRDGKKRRLIVKSDMDLWAAFLIQGKHSSVELHVLKNTASPTKAPTTPFPTHVPTTATPTYAFNSKLMSNSGSHLNWLNKELAKVNMRVGENVMYRMSTHGKSTSTFRSKVIYKGPFIFLLKTTNGRIFGSYTDINWTATGGSYFYCTKCFLFSLVSWEDKYTPYRMDHYRYPQYKTYHHTSYGPCYGGGHDMCINSPGTPSGYGSPNHTYRTPNSSTYYFDSKSSNGFKIQDWEIFPAQSLLPWQTAIFTMDQKDGMNWIASTLPSGKKMGYRCYRQEGLGMTNKSMQYFRNGCANKGPIMLTVHTTKGHIFGGYTGMSWCTNTCGYKTSSTAYLWMFKIREEKYNKKKLTQKSGRGGYATYHHTSYGPCFGGGHDLCIHSPGNKKGYANIGNTYLGPNGGSYYPDSSSTYNFDIKDWEVHVVLDK